MQTKTHIEKAIDKALQNKDLNPEIKKSIEQKSKIILNNKIVKK